MAEFRMPTQQEIIRDGKELGYVGTELQVYVKEMLKEAKEQQVKAEAKEQQVKAEAKEQQDRERDERIAVLNAKKEAEQAEQAKIEAVHAAEQAKIEAVHAAEQAKREAELQKVTLEETTKAVAIRAAAEEKEKEREFQLGLARLAADEKAREQNSQTEIKARDCLLY